MPKLPRGKDGAMRLRASARGVWPSGIHWTEGEERVLPAGYPTPESLPDFLEPVKAKKPAPKKAVK